MSRNFTLKENILQKFRKPAFEPKFPLGTMSAEECDEFEVELNARMHPVVVEGDEMEGVDANASADAADDHDESVQEEDKAEKDVETVIARVVEALENGNGNVEAGNFEAGFEEGNFDDDWDMGSARNEEKEKNEEKSEEKSDSEDKPAVKEEKNEDDTIFEVAALQPQPGMKFIF